MTGKKDRSDSRLNAARYEIDRILPPEHANIREQNTLWRDRREARSEAARQQREREAAALAAMTWRERRWARSR